MTKLKNWLLRLKKEKYVYYWFEGKNPSVQMIPEYNCFPTLEEAERRCNLINDSLELFCRKVRKDDEIYF